jgi:hypothetical protein
MLRVDALSDDKYRLLQDQHYYNKFKDELRMLLRVQNLYRRHPEIETIAADAFLARLFGEAEPAYETALLAKLADSDFEILQYLRDHGFALRPRIQFVSKRLAQLGQAIPPVACPVCKSGKLQLDAAWIDPNCCMLPPAD